MAQYVGVRRRTTRVTMQRADRPARRPCSSDLAFTIEDSASENGTVWVRAVARGTNDGSVMGQPPTHRPVTVDVIDIARIVDGRIVEHWGVPDRFALLAQVGVLRKPAPPTAPGPQ